MARARCGVTVLPTDLTIDAIASNYVTWIEGQPGIFPDGAALTDVALPAIEAKRIDMSHMEEGWQKHMPTSYYLFHARGRGYGIYCGADDAPTDRWLSIAESPHPSIPPTGCLQPPSSVPRSRAGRPSGGHSHGGDDRAQPAIHGGSAMCPWSR